MARPVPKAAVVVAIAAAVVVEAIAAVVAEVATAAEATSDNGFLIFLPSRKPGGESNRHRAIFLWIVAAFWQHGPGSMDPLDRHDCWC